MRATIEMYLPDKAFGFCESAGAERFYFHAEAFDRGNVGGPPPIPGEEVEIEGVRPREDKCPKVCHVQRLAEPIKERGWVRSFDPNAGWGFVETASKEVCFIHISDFIAPCVVSIGTEIEFYVGKRRERPRACYVVLPPVGDGVE